MCPPSSRHRAGTLFIGLIREELYWEARNPVTQPPVMEVSQEDAEPPSQHSSMTPCRQTSLPGSWETGKPACRLTNVVGCREDCEPVSQHVRSLSCWYVRPEKKSRPS